MFFSFLHSSDRVYYSSSFPDSIYLNDANGFKNNFNICDKNSLNLQINLDSYNNYVTVYFNYVSVSTSLLPSDITSNYLNNSSYTLQYTPLIGSVSSFSCGGSSSFVQGYYNTLPSFSYYGFSDYTTFRNYLLSLNYNQAVSFLLSKKNISFLKISLEQHYNNATNLSLLPPDCSVDVPSIPGFESFEFLSELNSTECSTYLNTYVSTSNVQITGAQSFQNSSDSCDLHPQCWVKFDNCDIYDSSLTSLMYNNYSKTEQECLNLIGTDYSPNNLITFVNSVNHNVCSGFVCSYNINSYVTCEEISDIFIQTCIDKYSTSSFVSGLDSFNCPLNEFGKADFNNVSYSCLYPPLDNPINMDGTLNPDFVNNVEDSTPDIVDNSTPDLNLTIAPFVPPDLTQNDSSINNLDDLSLQKEIANSVGDSTEMDKLKLEMLDSIDKDIKKWNDKTDSMSSFMSIDEMGNVVEKYVEDSLVEMLNNISPVDYSSYTYSYLSPFEQRLVIPDYEIDVVLFSNEIITNLLEVPNPLLGNILLIDMIRNIMLFVFTFLGINFALRNL